MPELRSTPLMHTSKIFPFEKEGLRGGYSKIPFLSRDQDAIN